MESSWWARVAFVLAVLPISAAPASAGPVSEAEAVRLFLEQSPQARRVPLAARTVEAELRVEARVANPEVTYQIEDAAGVRDEFLTLRQGLPVTGRRALLGERAEVASAAAGFLAERELQLEAYLLKQSFHEVLYRERLLLRLEHGAERLQRTVEILAAREREGEGAGYDLLRAEQELAELRMTAAQAEAELVGARSRFGSFYAPESGMNVASLQGDLAPASPTPEAGQAVEEALARRLDLRSLAAEGERLELERRAARRRRFPEPTLTAGWKRTESLGLSDSGYVAAVSVPLPIFDRGRLDSARAASAGARVELEAEILARRIRAEVRTAVAREQSARKASRAYGDGVERRAIELHRIARLRYDEGESGILELLDAHRSSLAMTLRALAATYEAKSAEIDRDRIIGIEVKP